MYALIDKLIWRKLTSKIPNVPTAVLVISVFVVCYSCLVIFEQQVSGTVENTMKD